MPAASRTYYNEFDNDDYDPPDQIDLEDIDTENYRQAQVKGFLIDREIKSGPAKRFVGVEVELAGGKSSPMPWIHEVRRIGHGCVSDGSIRASPAATAWNPVEITTVPANGRKFLEVMRKLNDAFKASKARTNSSCGTHVHVDARDLGWSGIRTLIETWRMIEPAMFQAVPASRRTNNTYCEPCGERYWGALTRDVKVGTVYQRDAWGSVMYDRNDQPIKLKNAPADTQVSFKLKLLSNLYGISARGKGPDMGHALKSAMTKYNQARYAALNIHSWLYRGTVEFRLGGGTVHLIKTTYPWARVCRAIVHFAATCNTEDLEIVRAAWNMGKAAGDGSTMALEALLCRVGEGRLCRWYADRLVEVNGGGDEE